MQTKSWHVNQIIREGIWRVILLYIYVCVCVFRDIGILRDSDV